MTEPTPDALAPDAAARLADFARACKAAARVVTLYPATHPAIQASLGRVADSGARLVADGPRTLTVHPDGLLLDGLAASRPDAAIAELADLLHRHLVGELTIVEGLARDTWHAFLLLLGRPPQDVRAEGGFGQAWLAAGGAGIEVKLVDYAEVLREREGGGESGWDRILADYLEGERSELDDETMAALADLAADATRLAELADRIVRSAEESGHGIRKQGVLRLLQSLADFVARHRPAELDRTLRSIAGTIPRLTPDLVVELITTGAPAGPGETPGIDLPGEVRARITDDTVAAFVAQSVARDHGATARLAQAFQALVPDRERHPELLELAAGQAAVLPIAREPDFPDLWNSAAHLLTTYSDAPYVSDEYGRELSTARGHAVDVERVGDDPPERVGAWLATISDDQVRRLDAELLVDLLRIETRAEAWRKVLDTAIAHLPQLVLIERIDLAQGLLDALRQAADPSHPRAAEAGAGLERLLKGPLVRHVILAIRSVPETSLAALSRLCHTLGPSVIGPLAEALSAESQPSSIRRLREVLLGFGAAGRSYADSLRSSPNPAVRRTAIELLRAFGGADALPDLAGLLDDAEPAVQREALRAIIQIGSDDAYATLEGALKSGSSRTRDAIMQALAASRDLRAAPLFVHILRHSDHRALEGIYMAAIEALGRIGSDSDSIAALQEVLVRGEWWAPFRTARLRLAAARALRACGADAAREALEAAAASGTRGVRRAARAALAEPGPRAPRGT
ncbi:MAG: HEAT repeat domain-containing protein [Acidobacteriota bacterium]